jgi:hypothetical protein
VIRVAIQPEPPDFNVKVRIPGKSFLRANPNPATWEEHWRKCLEDLHKSYGGICAYSAHWIPRCEGVATVDHFIPKSKKIVGPKKAYEWDNFRLASLRMNARKGDYEDVLDPFTIARDTFVLNFSTLVPEPGTKLSRNLAGKARSTIRRLKLYDNVCIETRIEWLQLYTKKELTLTGLKKRAPFLAYEIERQGLSPKSVRRIFRCPQKLSP